VRAPLGKNYPFRSSLPLLNRGSRAGMAPKKFYNVLDGLRGAAAIAVVMRHSGPFWGQAFALHESYLAVDLFFVLSGFVLAHAYEHRFASGLGIGEFLELRVIRLAPLHLLGLAMGVAAFTAMVRADPGIQFKLEVAALAIVFNYVFLPALPPLGRDSDAFVYNPPTWSLFFELAANFLYRLFWRWLSNGMLIAVCAMAALGLAVCAYDYGSLDTGDAWRFFPGGAARVLFGFPAGVLIYRLRSRLPAMAGNGWPLFVVLAFVFWCPVPDALRPMFDVCAVLLVMPALIAVGARIEAGKKAAAAFVFLGRVSYAIYVLHWPLVVALSLPFRGTAGQHVLLRYQPLLGIAFLAILLPAAWLVDRLFDEPVRNLLSAQHRETRRRRMIAAQ
jgi:peptidoglycan/LPS O-acetylase OafA/YrhL